MTADTAVTRRQQLIQDISAMTDEVGLNDLTAMELELLATLLKPAYRRVVPDRRPAVTGRPVLQLASATR